MRTPMMMRGVVVAVAMLAAVQSASAATWHCQSLGQVWCEAGKCRIEYPRVSSEVDSQQIDNPTSPEFSLKRIGPDRATYIETSNDGPTDFGYCWPLKKRR